ncbi:unnamed protein product [Cyprideis torosa]|uniref:Uncharacterized protein n=1 Tax=Cyprideis torosa TaxID=163714 RepID=A0A7R8W9V0_9CRUS|nr:unnamed protein product [Cyprideis torosa]CAG0890179.1 unnamed protein product [Cyprideis torosa]
MKWPAWVLRFLLSIARTRGFQVQFHRVNGEVDCVNDPPDIGIQYHVNWEVQCAINCVHRTKINDCLGYSWNQETSTCRLCNDGAVLDNRPDIQESPGTIVGFRDCATRCPLGWSYFGSKCYRFEPTSRPFQSAEDTCVAFGNGSHLASVHSQDENDFIRAIATSFFWLGANDRIAEGTFVNTDGTPFDFWNWNGQPDNWRGK